MRSGDKIGRMELTAEQYKRYGRHLILPEVGVEGQKKLLQSKILIIGTGGLGAPLQLYLAAAGIGTLGIMDFDVVDASNLQRQIIHFTDDVGRPKVQSAADKIRKINPDVKIVIHETLINSHNALDIIKDYDYVIDGTDNFPTRYCVNDACVILGKPNIYGSIFRFEGQATVFYPGRGPCYRCLYPDPPPPGLVPSCAEGGVLGILPGTIAMIQATEVIKLILNQGEPLIGRLILYDALGMKFRQVKLHRDKECPVCGDHPTIKELIDYEQFCGVPVGQETAVKDIPEITPVDLKVKLDRKDDFLLLDVREPSEYAIGQIPTSRLIPLNSIDYAIGELQPWKDKEIVLHCKMGGRSLRAAEKLKAAGFKHVINLAGGINAWSDQVDSSVPKY